MPVIDWLISLANVVIAFYIFSTAFINPKKLLTKDNRATG